MLTQKILIASCLFMLAVTCKQQEPQSSRLLDQSPCSDNRPTVKVAQSVKGRISVLDVDHPDVWVIVSMQGIIGEIRPIFDGPDIAIPCNLDNTFKKNNLEVIFSGSLKDSQGRSPPSLSTIYYSQLTNIQVAPKK